MRKKIIYLVFFVLVLVLSSSGANAMDPSFIGWWKLDEGSGTIAKDSSNSGNDGALNGDPVWVAGKIAGALEFDGGDDFVSIPDRPNITFSSSDNYTLATWVYVPEIPGGWSGIVTKGRQSGGGAPYYGIWIGDNAGTPTWYFGPWPTWGSAVAETGWSHVAVVQDGAAGTKLLYLNAEVDTQVAAQAADAAGNLLFGSDQEPGDSFAGIIDDVRLYSRALTRPEILYAMEGGKGYPYARDPNPLDGAFHEATWVTLQWLPGDFAVSHDAYLSENFDDVNDATNESQTFRGNQTSTIFTAGFSGFAYPEGLVPGTTYYWRIDEVNDAEPNSPWKGDVWSFSIPPKTAYSPVPADNAELVPLNATLTWTPGFEAKLHYVYFGEGFNAVNDAAGGASTGVANYNPGMLKLAKTYYWRVDESDGFETYKGEVWSFTTIGAASDPNPTNDAVDVSPTQILTWDAGTVAASHEVYFGADANSVLNATKASPEYKGAMMLGDESYDPGKLMLNTSYYWRIDEVNSTNPDSPWKGRVWSFTTGDFLVIDDFESYDVGNNEIWWSWKDGLGYVAHGNEPAYPGNGTGAAVGDESSPSYMEETIVHCGSKSMPLFYDNNKQGYAYYSETELTLKVQRDWTEEDVAELSIWFRGEPDNDAEPLYVAVSNSAGNPAVVAHNDPAAATVTVWTEWRIPLQVFADQGIDLTDVGRIAIGIGTKDNMTIAGGSGKMLFDDIRLYPPTPEPEP
jgi:hypothetical protein